MRAVSGTAEDITADVTPDKTVWKPSEVTEEAFTESTDNVIQMRETDYASFSGILNFGISLKKSKVSNITYELGEGVSIDGENPSSYVKEEGKVPLAPAVKDGYDFGGWYSDPDFENKIETLDQINGNTTLYPKFGHTIEYNLNGGELSGNYPDMVVEGKSYELPTPTKDGYEFVGWYTTPEFTEGTKVTTTEGLGEDTVLYAKFAAVSYGITYNLNGGNADSNSTNPTSWCIEDGEVTLAEPTKKYHKFLGWYDNNRFTGDPITSISSLAEEITLYAKWESSIAPSEALSDWTYTINEENETVTLSRYTGLSSNVIVYPSYTKDGKNYATVIASRMPGAESDYMFASTGVKKVSFKDGVKFIGNCSNMFKNCTNLTSINFGKVDTSEVTSMSSMFYGCSQITELDFSSFDTSKVTNMDLMFSSCSALTQLDLSNFDTSNVTDMSAMFGSCSALTELNLSSFDTSSVTKMQNMFSNCSGLTRLNLTGFNTSNVTSMNSMFSGCSSLTELDLSSFNTSNVTSMNSMFSRCIGLTEIDISNFNVAKVTNMGYMFSGCKNVTVIWVSAQFKEADNSNSMFTGCGVSKVTIA